MQRSRALGELTHGTYDLLVVGGGITGAGATREASLRGVPRRAGGGMRLRLGNE